MAILLLHFIEPFSHSFNVHTSPLDNRLARRKERAKKFMQHFLLLQNALNNHHQTGGEFAYFHRFIASFVM
jgi:hypothetical protein